ncbi:MAG: SAM-dependent methyltransferase [Planctomycetaceae bacterium]|nr:MAG: SAM-dependent methyltransferase [Planctomycetaceae bacterium]
MSQLPPFAILCCQNGVESAVKAEVADQGWRLAFSRRGFVSLKHAGVATELPSGVFVRTAAWSYGLIEGAEASANVDALVRRLAEAAPNEAWDRLHVWPRDRLTVGKFGFEPGVDEMSRLVGECVAPVLHSRGLLRQSGFNIMAAAGERVLDLILIEPSRWAIGWHSIPPTGSGERSGSDPPGPFLPATWPGGVQPIAPTVPVVSRAYFKAAEAIAWSGLELRAGDLAIEVGASPGGACGRLLELGMRVIGIDPADIDPEIMEHPRFRHIRARAGDLPRQEYSGARWLLVDSNVRPDQTLTTVEHIVTHRRSTIRGLLLTLKLGGIAHADRIPGWVRRVRDWGATDVKVRQLARGKMEVCLAAALPR